VKKIGDSKTKKRGKGRKMGECLKKSLKKRRKMGNSEGRQIPQEKDVPADSIPRKKKGE